MQNESLATEMFNSGKTAVEIATETGIPIERIEARLRAAEKYCKKRELEQEKRTLLVKRLAAASLMLTLGASR